MLAIYSSASLHIACDHSRAVDLWSLGCLSFELILNRTLLTDESWASQSTADDFMNTNDSAAECESEMSMYLLRGINMSQIDPKTGVN